MHRPLIQFFPVGKCPPIKIFWWGGAFPHWEKLNQGPMIWCTYLGYRLFSWFSWFLGKSIAYNLHTAPHHRIINHSRLAYHKYADDLQVYVKCKPEDIDSAKAAQLEYCLSKIWEWMLRWQFKINDDTTEFILFCNRQEFFSNHSHEKHMYMSQVVQRWSNSLKKLSIICKFIANDIMHKCN